MFVSGRSPILIIGALACILWPTARVHSQAKRRKPQTSTVTQRHVLTPREIAAKVSQSIVLIVTQDKDGEPIASGSGFFYDFRAPGRAHLPPGVLFTDGDIATNLHVFKRASQGYVKMLGEGVTYKITQIVAIDMQHDLCVFRAAGASAQPLTLATGTKAAVGDDVYVAGNPRGLEATVSKGIISAIRSEGGLIQIDAAISPGSSGGPVVNTRAEVVGIAASSLAESQNLNFAVDANLLAAVPLKWKVPISVAGALALRDREKDKLKGPVRGVATKTARDEYDQFNDRYLEGPSVLTDTVAYDHDGNLTEQSRYQESVLQSKMRFEYNKQGLKVHRSFSGKLVRETDEAVSENESINEKVNNANFSTVNEIAGTDKSGNRVVAVSQTYDKEGNEVETLINTKTGPERTVRTFDRNGWVIDETQYTNGKITYVNRYRYEVDEQSNWIKQYCTFYNLKYPQLGFTPSETTYREIIYFVSR